MRRTRTSTLATAAGIAAIPVGLWGSATTAHAESSGATSAPIPAVSQTCPVGIVCAYPGPNETGQQYKAAVPPNIKPTCYDVAPAGVFIASADNESTEPVELGNGTCSRRDSLDSKDVVRAKTKEELPDRVDSFLIAGFSG